MNGDHAARDPSASASPPRLEDACPRCRGAFHCGMGDATPCPCTTIALDDTHRRAIAARHAGCLCLSCLAAIAAGAPA